MSKLFLDLLNASISASWLVLAVLLARFCLKRAPRWTVVLLWAIVALRLLWPGEITLESPLSLVPSAETIPHTILTENSFDLQTGIDPVDERVNDYLGDRYYEGVTVPTNRGKDMVGAISILWVMGMVALSGYALISYLRIKRRVATAVRLWEGVYQSEFVTSPFVLGLIKPRIYLPNHMEEKILLHVLEHETAHIRRRDHWWKPVGYALLTLYWFNPVMWVAYFFLCRDIELACDERVARTLDDRGRMEYSEALLRSSVSRWGISACPLAFGEVGVKARIRSVLHYKRPAFWVIVAALVLCVVMAVCFLTNPLPKTDHLTLREVDGMGIDWSANYQVDLGREVGSGTLVVESWYRGEVIRSNQVLFTGKAKEFTLSMSVRRGEERNEGVDVDLKTDQYGGSLLTYMAFPLAEEVSGWSFASHKIGEKLTVTPGNDLVLAAMAFDTGNGVRSVDIKKLAEEPAYLANYDCILLIRAVFSEEEMEPQAIGLVPEEISEPKEVLTLDTIRKLSKKGEALSWADFEMFDYMETGSGLYIRSYETDDPLFTLLIGGTSFESEPMYIYIMANNGTEAALDIRTGDVDAFIEANRELPIMESLSGSWWWCRVEPKSGESINDEIAKLITDATGVPAGSDLGKGMYLPVIRITSSRELAELASLVEGEVYSHPDGTDSTPLQEKLKEYDDDYFAEKELVVVWPPDGNYTVNSVNYSQGTLSVVMENLWPDRDGMVPVVGDWLIPVEIGKVAGSDEISVIRSVAKPVGYPMRYFPRGNFLKNYTWWESRSHEKPSFYLYDSGEAVFNFTINSMNNGLATWKKADGKLTLISKEKEESYVFDLTAGGYRYNAISSTGEAGITHGALFR